MSNGTSAPRNRKPEAARHAENRRVNHLLYQDLKRRITKMRRAGATDEEIAWVEMEHQHAFKTRRENGGSMRGLRRAAQAVTR